MPPRRCAVEPVTAFRSIFFVSSGQTKAVYFNLGEVKMKKKIFALVLVILLVAALLPTASAASSLKLVIDGKTVSSSRRALHRHSQRQNARSHAPDLRNARRRRLLELDETAGHVRDGAYKVVFTIDSPKLRSTACTKRSTARQS
jgi:hypothetical protein